MPTPEPRAASTVALLRESDGTGIDVWLMRRQPSMAFAPGAHVFPGGAVEDGDDDPAVAWIGPAPGAFGTAFGVDAASARALVNAAVRETFEECGVLLATTDTEQLDTSGYAWEQRRLALLAGSMSWPQLMVGAGRAVRADLLVPWARWITPTWSPRRYDARFFLARVPVGQAPRWLGGEADQAEWVGVRAAVLEHDAGGLPMLPPTIATLRALALHDTIDSAFAAAPAVVSAESG